jgi:hypothetical protein
MALMPRLHVFRSISRTNQQWPKMDFPFRAYAQDQENGMVNDGELRFSLPDL